MSPHLLAKVKSIAVLFQLHGESTECGGLIVFVTETLASMNSTMVVEADSPVWGICQSTYGTDHKRQLLRFCSLVITVSLHHAHCFGQSNDHPGSLSSAFNKSLSLRGEETMTNHWPLSTIALLPVSEILQTVHRYENICLAGNLFFCVSDLENNKRFALSMLCSCAYTYFYAH